MAGGGSQDSTVTNVNQLDPVTQAWRQNIMGAGGALYNQGTPAYYPGQTWTPFSNQTQSGLDYLQNYAQQGAPGLQQAQGAMSQAMTGFNPAMPFAANAAQGGLSGNPAMGALGGFGGASNPYLDGLWNQGAEKVGNAVNGQFAQAGRFGANAAHTGALTQGLGNLYSQIYAPAYESERNRGLSAQQTMGGLYDAGVNRTMQGIGLFGDMYGQGQDSAMRAAAMLPGLYQYGQMPGQSMLDIGGMYEGQAQAMLDADQQRYNYTANAPWQYLSQYAGMMSGLPSSQSTTQTTTGPGNNNVMTGLGAASSLAGIYQAMGGASGLSSLFAFSDRRLKRDVLSLGQDARGLKWYEFAYLWDKPGVRHVGVMADEAPSHAVHMHPSGFLMVDYGAL